MPTPTLDDLFDYLPDESLVREKLDRALAPYADMLPPEVLAEFRDLLGDFMLTHPVMERMFARLRSRRVGAAICDVDRRSAEAGEEPESAAPVSQG